MKYHALRNLISDPLYCNMDIKKIYRKTPLNAVNNKLRIIITGMIRNLDTVKKKRIIYLLYY